MINLEGPDLMRFSKSMTAIVLMTGMFSDMIFTRVERRASLVMFMSWCSRHRRSNRSLVGSRMEHC